VTRKTIFLGFPVFVLERSPLVLRDLDWLKAINGNAQGRGRLQHTI